MKKKAVVWLLGAMTLAMTGSTAHAMTQSYSWSSSSGDVYACAWGENENGDTEKKQPETNSFECEEADSFESEIQERLSALEPYGVTYDAEQGRIWYQGRKVRWLIDEREEGSGQAIKMPGGEIDLYTVLGSDGQITGVRAASQEEYDERTYMDEYGWTETAEEVTVMLSGMDGETLYGYLLSGASETDDPAEKVFRVEIVDGGMEDVECTAEQSGSESLTGTVRQTQETGKQVESISEDTAEEVTTARPLTEAEKEAYRKQLEEEEREYQKKVSEYASAGITQDADGGWLWNGKPVYWLIDEDGGFYQNGSEEAKAERIYLVVKRKEDGSISEAKQVTAEELAAEKAREDMMTE